MSGKRRWLVVMGYAMAMAWVEAAVVTYLRILINRTDPYQPNPLPIVGALGTTELIREAATLLMLLAVGFLAGRDGRARLGFAAAAFGAWDLLYYAFLRIMTGWPVSLLDWDILFLLPLPWWGPVLAPAAIAALMLAGGTLLALGPPHRRSRGGARLPWGMAAGGAALALYCFMANALATAAQGSQAVRQSLPVEFPWPAFLVALGLLGAPVVQMTRDFVARRGAAGLRVEHGRAERTGAS
jgi:hypothetical protein